MTSGSPPCSRLVLATAWSGTRTHEVAPALENSMEGSRTCCWLNGLAGVAAQSSTNDARKTYLSSSSETQPCVPQLRALGGIRWNGLCTSGPKRQKAEHRSVGYVCTWVPAQPLTSSISSLAERRRRSWHTVTISGPLGDMGCGRSDGHTVSLPVHRPRLSTEVTRRRAPACTVAAAGAQVNGKLRDACLSV